MYIFEISCFILTNNTAIWNSHSSRRDPKATRISNVVKDDGLSLSPVSSIYLHTLSCCHSLDSMHHRLRNTVVKIISLSNINAHTMHATQSGTTAVNDMERSIPTPVHVQTITKEWSIFSTWHLLQLLTF